MAADTVNLDIKKYCNVSVPTSKHLYGSSSHIYRILVFVGTMKFASFWHVTQQRFRNRPVKNSCPSNGQAEWKNHRPTDVRLGARQSAQFALFITFRLQAVFTAFAHSRGGHGGPAQRTPRPPEST